MTQNGVEREDPFERLKKIKYLGCKKFYDDLNDLKILETLKPNEWLRLLMPPIKNAESQFVHESKWKYVSLETILRERPEMVWKFYHEILNCEVLPDKLKDDVKIMICRLPDNLFYRDEEWNSECEPNDMGRNLAINQQRIETLGKWALQELRSSNVITIDEAFQVSVNSKVLFTILSSKITEERWNKLLNFIKDVLEMTDLARCLQMTTSDTIRSEEEVSSICNEIPDLPKNFVRRETYCDELERALDAWNNNGGRILLTGGKDTGLTTLAIHGVRYAVRRWKVDKVVWKSCSACQKMNVRGDERTLFVLDAACCNIWSQARFAIVTSNKEIPIRDLKDVMEIKVDKAFSREDCHALISDFFAVFKSDSDTDPDDQFSEDLTTTITETIPNRMSALCETVDMLRDKAQKESNNDVRKMHDWLRKLDMRDWFKKLDIKNYEPAYWKNLDDDLQTCYRKLRLFCDTDARICVHSMASIWSDERASSGGEKRTRELLSDFARKLLLVKRNMHEGCQTYRLTSFLKSFLRNEVTDQQLLDMKQEVVTKYEGRDPDVRDEFYYRHIVSLLVEIGQLKKAVSLLTSFKFKKRRVESGTMGNFLQDFKLASQNGGRGRKLHLHWAMAEIEVPAVLASDDGHVPNHCASLRLVDAPCPRSSEASLRLHARHHFENCPFLPKLKNGRVTRRTPEGYAKAFPGEEFFTHLDCSLDNKFIALCSNLYYIYLLDSCSFEVVTQFDVKAHVFLVHFLSNDRFFAVANNKLRYFSISTNKEIVDETEKLGIKDCYLISQKICDQDKMTMANFERPVALQDSTLWISMDNGVFVYSCKDDGVRKIDQFDLAEEDASFLATCRMEQVQLAADCRQSTLRVLKFENAKLECVLTKEAEHNVRAAAWIGSCLVFSTAGPSPALTIGTVDLDKSVFDITNTLRISFSPNFALSCPTAEQVLFGEVGGQVAVFESRLTCETLLPLRRPHALSVPSGEGGAAQLLGAFEPQRVALFEWPGCRNKGFAMVPAAVPIALTESFYRRYWKRHMPDSVVKICSVGTYDLAVVVHKRKVSFVRLHDVHVLMQHRWPNDGDDEDALKRALCEVDAADGQILVVIATRERCVRYRVHEKVPEDLKSLPTSGNNKCYFESLVLCGQKLLCSASCSESDEFFFLFTFEEKWKDITDNTQITANHGVLVKDDDDADLLMLLPTKTEATVCLRFNLQNKSIYPLTSEVSKPIIFDVSAQAKRMAVVHQQRVAVYEFKPEDIQETVSEMQFDGAASIHTVCFLPDSENLLSIVFAANEFSNLKLCVWDITGKGDKDVFEIDIRNAITSFNFFDEQKLNSKLFWLLNTDTVLFLTERSLVKIDLKTLKSNLVLDSDWLLGSKGNRFDVHKSFASDENIYLVLDNAEMFWLQNVNRALLRRTKN